MGQSRPSIRVRWARRGRFRNHVPDVGGDHHLSDRRLVTTCTEEVVGGTDAVDSSAESLLTLDVIPALTFTEPRVCEFC